MATHEIDLGTVKPVLVTVDDSDAQGDFSSYPAYAIGVSFEKFFPQQVFTSASDRTLQAIPLFSLVNIIAVSGKDDDTRYRVTFIAPADSRRVDNLICSMVLTLQDLTLMLMMQGLNLRLAMLFVNSDMHRITPKKLFDMKTAQFAVQLPNSDTIALREIAWTVDKSVSRSYTDPSGNLFANENQGQAIVHYSAMAMALYKTHALGKGSVITLREMIASEAIINDSDEIVQGEHLTVDERMEVLARAELLNILMNAYHHALHSSPNLDSDDDDLGLVAEDVEKSTDDFYEIISASELSDTFTPVLSGLKPGEGGRDIALEVALESWNTPLSESWPDSMLPIRDFLLALDESEQIIFSHLFDINYTDFSCVQNAAAKFGAGRVTTALALVVASLAVKHAQFITAYEEMEDYPFLSELIEWIGDDQARQFQWQFIALQTPYQMYDIEFSKELLNVEQRMSQFSSDGIAVPRHAAGIMLYTGYAVLTGEILEDYSTDTLIQDAEKLAINLPGFKEFLAWFSKYITALRENYSGDEDELRNVVNGTAMQTVQQDMEHLESLVQNVSYIIPFLADLKPLMDGLEIGSEEWADARRHFIHASLYRTGSIVIKRESE